MSTSVTSGSGTFPSFISVSLIDLLAGIALAAIVIGVAARYVGWSRASPQRFFTKVASSLGAGTMTKVFFSELINRVLLQRGLISDRLRRATHLCMFWGFAGLSITTSLDYLYNQPGNYIQLLGGSLSPIRWLGNISGVVMLAGATISILRLGLVREFRVRSTFWEVWFVSLLFIAGLTGFLAEYFGDIAYATSPNIPPAAEFSLSFGASQLIVVPYGIHIVSIGLLFITAPISKFMHALTVPSLRYIDKLGLILTESKRSTVNEHKKAKEQAMIDQVRKLYEKS